MESLPTVPVLSMLCTFLTTSQCWIVGGLALRRIVFPTIVAVGLELDAYSH